jgi:AraC family transcriptional regulator, transcriptional activator of pobA
MEFDFNRIDKEADFYWGTTNLQTELKHTLDVGNSTLFFCIEGTATALLYNKKHIFRKGDILIANWDMHPVFLNASKNFSTNFCKMSDEVFYEIFRNVSSNFCQFTYNYPIFKLTKEQSHQLKIWIDQLAWLYENYNGENRKQLIINYLQSLVMVVDNEIHKIIRIIPLKAMPRQLEILREFGALLQSNIKEHHDVKFYAEKLLITPYYLSTITSKVMQETPKSLIDKQLIQEIQKGILLNTPLKVIADELHFEDTSYMSRFFKRHTQLTPSEYRAKGN